MVLTSHDSDEPWVPPRTIALSSRVISFAREFMESVNGERGKNWIVGIGWATSVTVKESPDAASKDLGPGLSLGAYRRPEVPEGMIDRVEGLEFVLHIPRDVWERSAQRRIEFDDNLLFKLKLL
jgi:hypothetical protein